MHNSTPNNNENNITCDWYLMRFWRIMQRLSIGWLDVVIKFFIEFFSENARRRETNQPVTSQALAARSLSTQPRFSLSLKLSKKAPQRDVCIKAMCWWRILFCYSKAFGRWRSVWKKNTEKREYFWKKKNHRNKRKVGKIEDKVLCLQDCLWSGEK